MKSVIAVFAKAPELGKVKTRLARTHGAEFALELAGAMLGDTLAVCQQVDTVTRLFLTPDGFDGGALWEGETPPQGEGDLWTRLLRADARLRGEGFEKVILIGADAPDLLSAFLAEALGALEKSEFVVGPSLDGGFYLLGSAVPLGEDVFARVPISSRDTLQALMGNLERLRGERGKRHAVLEAWRDVDEEEDLLLFIERLRSRLDAAPRCRTVLERWGLL